MAATSSPVEVGARGTIGSLVLQEIEYFKKLDLDRQQSPQKPKIQIVGGGGASSSRSSNPGQGLGFRSPAAGKKKKAAGNGGMFLPSICSLVEIAEGGWADRAPRIGYRNLKHEQS